LVAEVRVDVEPELLDSGRPDEEGALRRFRRAHPRVAVGALAVAAVAGAGWVAAQALSGPDLQALAVEEVILLDPDSEAGQLGDAAGAVLSRNLRMTVAAPGLDLDEGPWQVAALGLDGPGIVEVDGPAEPQTRRLEPGLAVSLTADVAVDCGAITLPVDAAEYGLRVLGGVGAGRATEVLPLGRIAEAWARAVDFDCARAEAARTARVLSVMGEVDPTRPIVDLRFLVENDGPHVVEVVPDVGYSAEVAGSLDLEPGTRQEVRVRMALDPCPTPDPEWGTQGPWSWPVGMTVAVAGVYGGPAGASDSFGRPRLDLDAAAARSLGRLLNEACAGLPWLVIDAPAEGVRYDPATRVLEGAVVVTPPADWAGRLSVGPAPAEAYGLTLQPLWQPSAFTGLGQTDPVTVPVRYRLTPGETSCGRGGLVVIVDIQAQVPAGAGARTARLQGSAEIPWPAGFDSRDLCEN